MVIIYLHALAVSLRANLSAFYHRLDRMRRTLHYKMSQIFFAATEHSCNAFTARHHSYDDSCVLMSFDIVEYHCRAIYSCRSHDRSTGAYISVNTRKLSFGIHFNIRPDYLSRDLLQELYCTPETVYACIILIDHYTLQ